MGIRNEGFLLTVGVTVAEASRYDNVPDSRRRAGGGGGPVVCPSARVERSMFGALAWWAFGWAGTTGPAVLLPWARWASCAAVPGSLGTRVGVIVL